MYYKFTNRCGFDKRTLDYTCQPNTNMNPEKSAVLWIFPLEISRLLRRFKSDTQRKNLPAEREYEIQHILNKKIVHFKKIKHEFV